MQPGYVRERRSRDSFLLFGVLSVAFAFGACGNTSDDQLTALDGAGEGGATQLVGGAGGKASAAGVDDEAGSGGVAGEGGAAGASGSAVATVQPSACEPGGTLFAAGNYSDTEGNELWLRRGSKALTLALIPSGPANAANLPQLFVIDRVCAGSAALLARDASSAFRFDFSVEGNALAVCMSAAVASVDAALLLPAVDISHAGNVGCLGKPIKVFTPEAVAP
jgi:hypothetical protein